MEIDRRKFIKLVLTTGLGPSLMACRRTSAVIPDAVEPTPAGGDRPQTWPVEVEAMPADESAAIRSPYDECIDWAPSGECIDWEPYAECIDWSPSGECIDWRTDYDMIPYDECVRWDPQGECIGWGDYDPYSAPAAECVDWNPRGECVRYDHGPTWE